VRAKLVKDWSRSQFLPRPTTPNPRLSQRYQPGPFRHHWRRQVLIDTFLYIRSTQLFHTISILSTTINPYDLLSVSMGQGQGQVILRHRGYDIENRE
jgi:hypothetical protein